MRPPIPPPWSVPVWAAPARATNGPAGWPAARATAMRRCGRRFSCSWTEPTPSSLRRNRPWPGCRHLSPEIGDRLFQPVSQRMLRPPSQLAAYPGRLHCGAALLAGPGRSMPVGLLTAGELPQDAEDLVDGGLSAGSDIEDADRAGAGGGRVRLGHIGASTALSGCIPRPRA